MKSRFFTTSNGREYEIIRIDYGDNYHHTSAIDYVKSLETGKVKQMKRLETIKFSNK